MSRLTDQTPFRPFTSKYKPTNAYWMAKLAKIAYEKNPDGSPNKDAIQSQLEAMDPNFMEVEGFDFKSSQGIVIKHEQYVVAAFRGTDEIADWLDNINAVSKPGPLGDVHNGFYRALMDVWPEMKTAIRHFRKRPYRICRFKKSRSSCPFR